MSDADPAGAPPSLPASRPSSPLGAPPSPLPPPPSARPPAPGSAPAPGPVDAPPGPDDSAASDARTAILAVRDEVAKVVVGQDGTMSGLVAALLARGHVLLEGVPGVAKTLIVKTLAAALDLDVKRVQFTPDLMPSDVTGQLILDAPGAVGAGGSGRSGGGEDTRNDASAQRSPHVAMVASRTSASD